MVGTAYLRANPDAKPFVEIGSRVAAGDKLLLIEAMKTFNDIVAPKGGRGDGHSGRGRPAGRIWRAPPRDRVGGATRCSTRSSSPIAAKSRCASCARPRSSASRPSRCIRPPTPMRCMSSSPTNPCASARRRRAIPISTFPPLLSACEITGADAVHPGYGFLSENARFAEILDEHDIAFIGPKAEHIRLMGDKIEAKATAKKLGIPCVPGSDGRSLSEKRGAQAPPTRSAFRCWSRRRRRRRTRHEGRARRGRPWRSPIAAARTEAKAAFGDDTVYLEKYLEKPRHIEIQIFGDGKGHAIHLGERDCSLQRRHQKIWEESPSPALNDAQRKEIGEVCAQRHARAEIRRRRHDRVPLRERRILFHRDEHAHSGRASGDGDDHRRRSRLRTDPHRRRLAPLAAPGRHLVLRPRDRMPGQRRAPRDLPPLARAHRLLPSARRRRRARRFGGLSGLRHPAEL